MSDFKIGDRVECTNQETMGPRVGTKGTVGHLAPDEGMIAVIPDGEAGWHWFDADNFKIESEAT